MYVCAYIHICINIYRYKAERCKECTFCILAYIYTCIYICIYMYTYMCVYIYTNIYMYMYIYICVYIHHRELKYANAKVRTYIYMYMYMYTYICEQVYVCVYPPDPIHDSCSVPDCYISENISLIFQYKY